MIGIGFANFLSFISKPACQSATPACLSAVHFGRRARSRYGEGRAGRLAANKPFVFNS